MSKKADSAALALDGPPPPADIRRADFVDDAPKRRPLKWDGELDITTLTLPHMMAMTGGHGIVIGQDFAGGGNFSGIVKRMTKMPDGVIRIILELGASGHSGKTGRFGAFLFFGNGMYAEMDDLLHEPITEENSGPWQKPIGTHR